MLTGDYEKDKAELERLIAHEEAVMLRMHAACEVAHKSFWRYQRMLEKLQNGKSK